MPELITLDLKDLSYFNVLSVLPCIGEPFIRKGGGLGLR